MTRIDWPKLMIAGMRGLGLRPAEFWALTPGELMMMLGANAPNRPLVTKQLEALMRAYPDIPDGLKGSTDG